MRSLRRRTSRATETALIAADAKRFLSPIACHERQDSFPHAQFLGYKMLTGSAPIGGQHATRGSAA